MICLRCGLPFERSGYAQKYCSKLCNWRSREDRCKLRLGNNYQILRRARVSKHRHTIKGKYSGLKCQAKVRGLEFTIPFVEYIQLMNKPCIWCGISLPTTGGSLDRINSELGYTLENVVPCCPQCNLAKLDYSVSEFREWIARVYAHQFTPR